MPYEQHPVFAPASDRTPIWRYIDFTKLMSMLVSRTLFFCRSDLLDDRFEGSMSRANLRARDSIQTWLPAALHDRMKAQLAEIHEAEPKRTFINSWSMGRYESVALWRLYVGSREGVALRSTFGRLTRSLEAEPRPVHVGQVHYIDYDVDPIPEDHVLHPFVYKRQSFDFERELRAVVQNLDTDEKGHLLTIPADAPPGLFVPCRLETLISTIRVSPASGAWFGPLVRSVLKTYGLDVEVEESNLLANPVY
jgi:hypothetical protein